MIAKLDPTWVRGVDVSKFQLDVDFDRVRAAGVVFVVVREGESDWSTADDRWPRNWRAAHDAGLVVTTYHAIHGGVDPRTQARILRDRCRDFRPGLDAPPWLDWEVAGGGHEPEDALAFVEEAEALFGVRLVVYTGEGFADRWPALRETALAARPLAVAHYGVASPTIPRAWGLSGGAQGWAFWQYACDGRVDGISTNVDLDVFGGSRAEFDRFIAGSVIAPGREVAPGAVAIDAPVRLAAQEGRS